MRRATRPSRAIAECLGGQTEIAARLGGEEFVLLLPETDVERARNMAEGMRRAIAARDIDIDGTKLRGDCSFGVAVAQPGANIDDILRRADDALYAAKRNGRDRVAVHNAETPPPNFSSASVIRRAGDRADGAPRLAVG